MRLIEWFLFALPYIATGGAVFTEWGRNHKALVVLSGLVALITTGYFIRDRYLEYRTSEPHEITTDVATLKFFDPNTSKPRVWYLMSQAGGYTLYDAPGFDPITGIPLLPITPEIAQDLLSKAATAKAEERRHAEEAQKARQRENDREAADALQRKQDERDRVRAQEQAKQKAAQDEIDRQNAIVQQRLQLQRQQQEQQQALARQRDQQQNEWRRTHNGCNIGMRWACFDCQRTNAPECIHIGGNGGCGCFPN
jgi:type IV secretory pathway VirB10-like protein